MTRRLAAFMGAMILANISGNMHMPLLPLYLQKLGAGVGQVGLFFTVSSVAPLLFQIFGGWLSDSIGRLRAVAIGSLAGVGAYTIFVFSPDWRWLLLATALGSMSGAFVAPSYQAFIAEESAEGARGRVYGLSSALFSVVGVVGPPIGGYLSQYLGFRAMYIVAWALYFAATVIRIWMARAARLQEAATSTRPSLIGLKTSLASMGALLVAGGVITWIFLSDGVRDVSFSLAFQLLPLYMQNLMGMTNVQIGWLSSIASLATMILLTPAGWLSDRKGERLGIVSGFALIALALGIFLRSRLFAGFAVAWALIGVGQALIDPAYSSLISKVVPQRLRGTAFGVFSTSIGLISLPAPAIGAMLWERFSPQVPFYVPLVTTVLLLPVMWRKFKLPREEHVEETP
ncbi:MAG TPA: MFS transporter [Anaerolineae bacterium]|nr:MFS transporter [Anaerolineae bacterium]